MNWFSRYIAYLKNNSEGYWFKRKLFGWGWTPATWQGWAITLIAVLAIVYIVVRATNLPEDLVVRQGLVPVILITVALIVISYLTGETPRWQWGWPKKVENNTPPATSLSERIDRYTFDQSQSDNHTPR